MNENQRLANVQNRTHLSIRQLVVFVLSLLLVGVMVLTNRRDYAVVESAIAPVPVMPVVSLDQRISTSWFCPGVPGNDGTISGSIVVSNPSDADFNATVTRLGVGVSPVVTAVTVAARSQVAVNVRKELKHRSSARLWRFSAVSALPNSSLIILLVILLLSARMNLLPIGILQMDLLEQTV
jgi:hypothetical protein